MKQSSVRQWFSFLLIMILIWEAASFAVNNSIILPSPFQVVGQMISQSRNPDFLYVAGMTILRALIALALSLLLSLNAAYFAAFCEPAAGFINRLVSVMQTVPNVCYVILLLFWTSREMTVILTGFFLLFPLSYRSFYERLKELIEIYSPLWKIYPQPAWVLMIRICLPMLRPAIREALNNASSLSFKACVTSEILTGLAPGIGRSLQLCRLDLNVSGVFAWSIWLIILVFLFETLWNRMVLSKL